MRFFLSLLYRFERCVEIAAALILQKHSLLQKPWQLAVWLVLALLAATSMWFYVDRILVGHQVADAAAHDRPRGNLSDLYPRWLGARELLLHQRNPYSDEVALEIQKGYYGRALDPARPEDPKDRQGFAYPVYVVFLLAPVVGLSFHSVQLFFYWLLIALTAATVPLWSRALSWRPPPVAVAVAIALTLGSVPAVQGIKLQQLSLLVAALLAGSAACVASGFLFCGGAILALATIKPQLAWPMVLWLFALGSERLESAPAAGIRLRRDHERVADCRGVGPAGLDQDVSGSDPPIPSIHAE